jgi:hypothetical protein
MKTFITLISLIRNSKDYTLDYETVDKFLTEIVSKNMMVVDNSNIRNRFEEYMVYTKSASELTNMYNPFYENDGPTATHPIRTEPKIQRNSLCSCGSNKKYKNCCIKDYIRHLC